MARTIIIEPNPGGHRFQAVANIAARALRTGPVTLLTSHGARARAEFENFLADSAIEVEEVFDNVAESAQIVVAAVLRAGGGQPIDTVVIMDGDHMVARWWYTARALHRLRPRPRVVYFFTRYPAKLSVRHRRDLPFWRIRIAKAVFLGLAMLTGTIDRAAGFAGRDNPARGWLVKRARDPATCVAHSRDRAALRELLGLPQDRLLVGLYGGINARKNPALAFEAMLRTGLDADLVLAGPVDEFSRRWLDSLDVAQRSRVIVDDGFLSDERLDQHLAASDVVVLLMTLEGPSGIQGKAIAAGVPVLTAGSKTRARELAAIGTGVATAYDVDSVAEGMRRVLTGQSPAPAHRLSLPTGDTFAEAVLGR